MDDFKYPQEVRAMVPQIIWNDQQIGWLFSCGLVRGRKLRRGCLVSVADIVALHQIRIKIQV